MKTQRLRPDLYSHDVDAYMTRVNKRARWKHYKLHERKSPLNSSSITNAIIADSLEKQHRSAHRHVFLDATQYGDEVL